MDVAHTRGLHELGHGLDADLQPDGGWGWSNAGLVTADRASLLVDTLFAERLTATCSTRCARSPTARRSARR